MRRNFGVWKEAEEDGGVGGGRYIAAWRRWTASKFVQCVHVRLVVSLKPKPEIFTFRPRKCTEM